VTEKTYTTGQLARISGIRAKRLRRWDAERVLSPALRKARGSVVDRAYTLDQALGITALGELLRGGVGDRELRRAALLMPGSIATYRYLVFVGRRLCPRSEPEGAVELLLGRSGRVIEVKTLLELVARPEIGSK
jgi:hypothetical protein